MKRKIFPLVLYACGALLGFALVGTTHAADVAKLAETCASCHGKDGASTEADVPIIGGDSATYIADNMAAYKQKERPCPEVKYRAGEKKGTSTDMCKIASGLSDSDVKDLAKYYSGKKFARAAQKFDPGLVAKGKKLHEDYCEKCHSEGGSVASDDAAILAGQHTAYLDAQIKDYVAGKRVPPKKMQPMLKKVDKDDFQALLNYYASFK